MGCAGSSWLQCPLPPSFPELRGPGVGSRSESFNWTCFLAKPVLLNLTTARSPPFLFVLVKGELCNVSSELAVFEHGYELAVQELSDKLFPCTVILQVVYEAELYLTNSVYLNTQFLISTINFKGCLISPVTEREVFRRALAQKQMWGKSNSIPLTASRWIYPHGCPCSGPISKQNSIKMLFCAGFGSFSPPPCYYPESSPPTSAARTEPCWPCCWTVSAFIPKQQGNASIHF